MERVSGFIALLVFFAVCQFSGAANSDGGVLCDCDARACPDIAPDQCPYGLALDTLDPCQCCSVCGNGVDEYCDPDDRTFDEFKRRFDLSSSGRSIPESITMRWDPREHHFGGCGPNMRCRPNIDLPKAPADIRKMSPANYLKGVEAVCVCIDDEMVCGTDGVTYDNRCQLKKTAVTSRRDIEEWRLGKCPGVPDLVTPPSNVVVLAGERALLHCEIASQPLPTVEWRRNGIVLGPMPGDNERYLVHQHGGPERFMVTTWLDIANVTQRDAGVYMCNGQNMYGGISGDAAISVIEKPDVDVDNGVRIGIGYL